MYTSEEIQGAVEKLVRASIRRPYGPLGTRTVGTTLNDLQDAAAGLFLLYPTAPYYLARLSATRLRELVATARSTVANLLTDFSAVARHVRPLQNVSALENAAAALQNLDLGLSSRSGAMTDISSAPAYQRFADSVQRHLDEVASRMVNHGQLVATPVEARTEIVSLLSRLADQVSTVSVKTGHLQHALDEYLGLQLASSFQQSLVDNARKVVDGRAQELSKLTPEGRLAKLRESTLDVLAAQAVLAGFGTLGQPGLFAIVSGQGRVYADVAHPATPAALAAQLVGPYGVLTESASLQLTVDGQPVSALLPAAYVASLDGLVAEPFAISTLNDQLVVEVTGYPRLTVSLPNGPTVRVVQDDGQGVADRVNASLGGRPLEAEPYARQRRWTGQVDIVSGAPVRMNAVGATDFTALGIQFGDGVCVLTGVNEQHFYLVDAVSPTQLQLSLQYGGSTTSEAGQTIEIGDANRAFRLKVADPARAAALANNTSVGVYAADDDEPARQACFTLGLVPLMTTRCRRVTAQDLAESVKKTPVLSLVNQPRLTSSAEWVSSWAGLGRTEPSSSLVYVLYKLRAQAVVAPGLTATFTVQSTTGALVGDLLVVRESSVAVDVGKFAELTEVTETTMTAVFGVAITSVSAYVEVGPNLTVPNDCVLRIGGGTVNDGEYLVGYQGTRAATDVPFELPLLTPVPVPTNVGGLPYLSNTDELGGYRAVFSSLSTGLSTSVRVNAGGSAALLFTTIPSTVVGTTGTFELPGLPRTVEIGDLLELYQVDYRTPSAVHRVVGLELSQLLITVDPELSVTLADHTFGATTPPFARIRKLRHENWSTLYTGLTEFNSWAADQQLYFQDLQRLVNPLMYGNPTVGQVGQACQTLDELELELADLDSLLATYEATQVPQMDALVSSFVEKGADRAVDLLLDCRFNEFFSLTLSGTSYSGQAMEAMRDMQMNDLPVRKVGRGTTYDEGLVAAYEEPDAEFDRSDIEEVNPDFPVGGEDNMPV
jgi:hypothetical protein